LISHRCFQIAERHASALAVRHESASAEEVSELGTNRARKQWNNRCANAQKKPFQAVAENFEPAFHNRSLAHTFLLKSQSSVVIQSQQQ
jgi:hypothetical protein